MSKKQLDENLIYKFKLKNKITSIKKSQTTSNIVFNQFLLYYIALNQKRKKSFPTLNILNREFKESRDKKTFYYFITTKPYMNHPFTLYSNYNSDTINIIIPVGREIGQYNLNKIHKELKHITLEELKALSELIGFTIKLRKSNFLNQTNPENQFYNCSNLVECDTQINQVQKKYKNDTKLFKKIEDIYIKERKNVIKHIKKYFDYLKNNKFNEAKKYLTTIKNIYIRPKDIVGHLAILIDIYKLNIKVKELI